MLPFRFLRTAHLVPLLIIAGLAVSARPASAQFGPVPSFASATNLVLSTNPTASAVADLNHDGILDIVFPVNAAGGIIVAIGNGTGGVGNGTFTMSAVIPVGPFPEAVAIADFNKDTHPDLAVTLFGPDATATGDNVSILLGTGTGTFGAATPFTVGTNPFGAAAGDINNDTNIDLVVVNDGSNNASVLLGNGNGSFAAPVNFPVGGNPRDVKIGLLNADAFPDVVVTNSNGLLGTDQVSVLLGTGTAALLAAQVTYTSGGSCQTVALGDLSGDGALDIVTGNAGGGSVSVLLGNGNGTFATAANYSAGNGPSGVAMGDFNLDGKLDVAVTNNNETSMTVLRGNGAGLLSSQTNFTTGTGPLFIGVGDFNSDGRPDIVVTNLGGASASVFLNNLVLSYDLAITKTGPTSVVAGQNIIYTISVTNSGPNSAPLVSVADPAPAGLSFVSNTGACTTAFPCALGTLAPGANRTITSTFLVAPGAASPVQNTASVSPTGGDPVPANNTAPASSTVTYSANLGITKTGPATVTAGQNVVYTITVTNAGPSSAASTSVADTPPAGLNFVSNTGACATNFPCALGTVAPGQVATITSTFQVPSGYAGASPIQNSASVTSLVATDPVPANNTATASTNVTTSANLAITKTGPATVVAGQNIVYTITVTNNGPSNAANVSVADPLPTGLTFVSNTGACTNNFPCALNTLTSGQVATITSTYTVSPAQASGSQIGNTATVSSTTTDPTPANNTATATTNVTTSANLAISKTGPASAGAGQNLTYAITVTNNGPSNAASVSVADPLPAGLIFVSNTGACTNNFPCALNTLTSGQVATITSTYSIPANYSGANPVLNTATVTTTTTDPTPGNNTSTASTTIVPASADLAITKTGPANGFRGSSIVYTITVTNNGPTAATTVAVADTTPAGLTFVSNTGDCTSAFPCSLGTVPQGATRRITATFDVPADYAGPEPLVNSASVSSATPDPVSTNNSASASSTLDRLSLNTLEPCRVLDTRDPAAPLGGPALAAGATRSFTIRGACGVPTTARAVSINITVTQPTDAGDLRLYPSGSTAPLASAINYSAGQTRANNAVVPLGTGGAIEVLSDQATGTVHFILDVNGYLE